MKEEERTGREPALGGEGLPQLTGQEPCLAGSAAVARYLAALDDESVFVRERAVMALRRVSGDVVPQLVGALDASQSDRRKVEIIAVLGRLGDARAVPAIADFLHNSNEELRITAIKALGRIGDEKAVPALIDILSDEKLGTNALFNPYNLAAHPNIVAVTALGQIGSPKAVPILVHLLPYVGGAAITALARIGTSEALQALIDILEQENEHMRSYAVEILGNFAIDYPLRFDRSITDAIACLLDDGHPQIRKTAIIALGKIDRQIGLGTWKNEVLRKIDRLRKDDEGWVGYAADEVYLDMKKRHKGWRSLFS